MNRDKRDDSKSNQDKSIWQVNLKARMLVRYTRTCVYIAWKYITRANCECFHFMKFHFMVSRRSRGLRFGAENWSNRCDALAFTSLPLEAQVIRTLSGQIILRNLLFTLPHYTMYPQYLLYTSMYTWRRAPWLNASYRFEIVHCTSAYKRYSTWINS